jgi:hypothetical protein
MAHDPRHPRDLSPDQVGTRVAEILAAAERDAQAVIEAARRQPLAPLAAQSPQPAREAPAPPPIAAATEPPAGEPPAPPNIAGAYPPALEATLAQLAQALQSLAGRIDTIEQAIDARLEQLVQAVSLPADDESEPVSFHPEEAGSSASSDEVEPLAGGELGRALHVERVRAIDLALRGYTRAQIAAELSSSLSNSEVERVLDEVLERD